MKHDKQKPRIDLLEPEFIIGIAEVMTRGMEIYGEDDWKTTENPFKRHYGAMMRHALAIRAGEWIDKKSSCPHIYMVCSNAMILDYFYRKDPNANYPYVRSNGHCSHSTDTVSSRSTWRRLWDNTKAVFGF